MAVFTTYDKTAGNLKRDVSEIIYQVSPEEVPVLTTANKKSITSTLYEWQQDQLAAANPDNAQVQGFTASYSNPTDVTMKSNRTQIFAGTASVSATLEAVDKHGIASQVAYQVAQKGREIKRDIEAALVGRDQAAVTGSTSAAAKMASVINQISSNTTTATASGGVVTEAAILSAHQKTFEKGGNPTLIIAPPAAATTIAGFATASGRNRDIEGTELINSVDLIVSSFGELQLVIDRFCSADDVILVDTEYLCVATLRPFNTERMARVSDSQDVMITTELTNAVEHDEAHGLVTITA